MGPSLKHVAPCMLVVIPKLPKYCTPFRFLFVFFLSCLARSPAQKMRGKAPYGSTISNRILKKVLKRVRDAVLFTQVIMFLLALPFLST